MDKYEREAGTEAMASVLLPHLPRGRVEAIYRAAPGNEIGKGKFENPESSAALVANAFGFFLDRPDILPALPGLRAIDWSVSELSLECQLLFPWTGGRHPCLDVVIRTQGPLIGVESKRYEPYRPKKQKPHSAAYRRDVWGEQMLGYAQALEFEDCRQGTFSCLDAAQLVKHAFAIRTQVHRAEDLGRTGILYYLYADPAVWPDGSPVSTKLRNQHQADVRRFSEMVADCEVRFIAATYRDVLQSWRRSRNDDLVAHAEAVSAWLRIDC